MLSALILRINASTDRLELIVKFFSMAAKETTMNKYEDGFLQQNMENCNCNGVCEGGCDLHDGELKTVRVIDQSGNGHDWGYYRYCENAVRTDKDRGFNVYVDGDELFKPNAAPHSERAE